MGAFTTYQDLGEFEIKLEKHLRKIIEAQLPPTETISDQKPVATWTSGSPFRGLEAFDFAHAPIFFGRVRAIGDVLALLRQRMAEVEDARALNLESASIKPAAFVLVSAMSGVGKSSLVRAGVLPLLVQPGDGIALWRRAVMRPGEASDNLFDGLARALCRPEALPELVSGEATVESIGAMLRQNPAAIEFGLSAALDHASGLLRQEEAQALRQWQQESRQEGRTHDAERAAQLLEELKTAKKPARLILVIDQLEELFTLEKLKPASAKALSSPSPRWPEAARPTSSRRCAAISLPVAPRCRCWSNSAARMASTISRLPRRRKSGRSSGNPRKPQGSASNLFRKRDRTSPSACAMRRSAIPRRCRCSNFVSRNFTKGRPGETTAGCATPITKPRAGSRARCGSGPWRSTLRYSLRKRNSSVTSCGLSTTVALDEAGIFNRRWADYAELTQSPAARNFVEAFLAPGARLFVADQTDDGRKIVSVAHEALLTAWSMLRDCSWRTARTCRFART